MLVHTPWSSANTCHRCGLVSTLGRQTIDTEGAGPLFLFVRYIDRNRRSNSVENLKLVCSSRHIKEDSREWGEGRSASEFPDANKQRWTWRDPAN